MYMYVCVCVCVCVCVSVYLYLGGIGHYVHFLLKQDYYPYVFCFTLPRGIERYVLHQ
jgi:hypothetical protein